MNRLTAEQEKERDRWIHDMAKTLEEIDIPKEVDVRKGFKIVDVRKYIDSHLDAIEGTWGQPCGRPYARRLIDLRDRLFANEELKS